MKQCARCRELKPAELYGKRKAAPDGLHPYCRPCNAEYQRANYSPADARAAQLKTKYGVTPAWYEEQLLRQNDGCAVCGSDGGQRGLFVDHSHETGVPRGLLCSNCNASLGLMQEDPDRIKGLALYIQSYT